MHKIINNLIQTTKEYENKYSKKLRSEKSQFFTPIIIAQYMSELFDINDGNYKEVKVLDPAGGTGILSVILLSTILYKSNIKKVILDIYEIDKNLLPILKKNIVIIKNEYKKSNRIAEIRIYNENFITHKKKRKYDIVIGNPPFKKISISTVEAETVSDLLYGQPNLYMIFIVHSLMLLENKGQLVFVVPRSFFNGKYFTKFRRWIYNNYSISFIHSFESRKRIFNDEILQELVIIKITKKANTQVLVNYSINDKDIEIDKAFQISNKLLWGNDKDISLRLPVNTEDVELLMKFDAINTTLNELSLNFKTGPVVTFRVKNALSSEKDKNSVPLIWSANFDKYKIKWALKNTKFKQYLNSEYNRNLILPASDYILIKRFSSKEEGKCLNLNILLKDELEYDYIAIENHVNYLRFDNNKEIMKGVFISLNSTFYNRYFKIINGTTQINTTDLNKLPIFPYEILKKISSIDVSYEELSSEICDNIVESYLDFLE